MKPQHSDVVFHKDGKTASVDLLKYKDGIVTIKTNGKPDASINMSLQRDPTADESTMVMAAAIPLAMNLEARTVANIGMGSGLTTHALLAVPGLERVDTIEIEQAIVEAAKGFRPRVDRAYTDPRSRIIIDDAKTFFSRHQQKYDIIISEPSNPWVSGVSGLFSREFYDLVRSYLNDNGIYVQWFQLYEINIGLVASVLKALSLHFNDYVIYSPDNTNILIVACDCDKVPELDPRILTQGSMGKELDKIGIKNFQDFELRRVGGRKVFEPFFASFTTPPNSDYHPVLDQNAAKARFLGDSAGSLAAFGYAPLPIVTMLENRTNQRADRTSTTPNRNLSKSAIVRPG